MKHREAHLVSVVPVGCLCPWGATNVGEPWERLRTQAGCPVHDLPRREDLGGL